MHFLLDPDVIRMHAAAVQSSCSDKMVWIPSSRCRVKFSNKLKEGWGDSYNILGDYSISSCKLLAIILAVRGTGNSSLYTICKRNSFLVSLAFVSNLRFYKT